MEPSDSEDVGDVEDTMSDATYHDAVETQGESPSDESDLSGSDREREVQTVRRTTRQRVPKRVLTYDSLGGEPKIKRYTLYYCGNWDAAV